MYILKYFEIFFFEIVVNLVVLNKFYRIFCNLVMWEFLLYNLFFFLF